MKRILIAFMILTFAVIGNAAELTVLEYYGLLPKELFKTRKYEIKNKNGKYYVNSVAEYEEEIIVDLKNKYLEISDQGTGGGTVVHEFAVFLRAGMEPVVGLSEINFDGVVMESYVKFYEYSGKKWIDVTGKLLQEQALTSFIDADDKEMTKLAAEFKDNFSFIYTIPRYGTTMKCSLDYTLLSRLANSDDVTSETKRAKKLESGIKYNATEFLWDYKKGVFTPGKKMKE
jgi:hypothetical protein